MTIKEYIKIHSNETFEHFFHCIVIKPFSLFNKDRKEEQEALVTLYKKLKENGAWKPELVFFDLKDLAKKVDFGIEPKKFHIAYSTRYSYDADPQLIIFVDDALFIKISKSCNDEVKI